MNRKKIARKAKTRGRRSRLESLERRNLLATIQVTTADDIVDATDGVISLREAIITSNANAGLDRIEFDASLDNVPITISRTGAVLDDEAGDFDLLDDVEIVGNAVEVTLIDGAQVDRVFHVHSGVDATFTDLTIRNGLADDTGRLRQTMFYYTLQEDIANGYGGGLLITGGNATLERSRVTGNTAVGKSVYENTFLFQTYNGTGAGGGIFADGDSQLTLVDSVLSGNEARGVSGGDAGVSRDINHYYFFDFSESGEPGQGGGLAAVAIGADSPSVTITGSRIISNKATGGNGGKGYLQPFFGTRLIGRGAPGGDASGGGIFTRSSSVVLRESSVTGNVAEGGTGGRSRSEFSVFEAFDGARGGDASGAGVAVVGGDLTVENATIAINRTIGGEGAAGGNAKTMVAGDGGDAGVSRGAGISIDGSGAMVTTTNVTLHANRALSQLGGSGGSPGTSGTAGANGVIDTGGGGVSVVAGSSFDATASLIANNTAITGPDVLGAFTSANSVLLEDPTDATGIVDGVSGNLLGRGSPTWSTHRRRHSAVFSVADNKSRIRCSHDWSSE